MTETTREDWLDRAALGASVACLVHCLALPLVLAALPALAAIVAIPESVHLWVLLFAIPTSGYALIAGRAKHGIAWPLCLGAAGLILLAVGALALEGSRETAITVSGSLALAAAHLGNWRARHR
ncbi:MAG TPA: MerC domain-containing protein [Sphingomonas sp.]|nr:MerC domain-containing protein [Sphingomonas sp.]